MASISLALMSGEEGIWMEAVVFWALGENGADPSVGGIHLNDKLLGKVRLKGGEFWFSESFHSLTVLSGRVDLSLASVQKILEAQKYVHPIHVCELERTGVSSIFHWTPFSRAPRAERTEHVNELLITGCFVQWLIKFNRMKTAVFLKKTFTIENTYSTVCYFLTWKK